MGLINNIFGQGKRHILTLPSATDLHSHIIPGIDDGSQTMEDSIELIMEFKRLGYRKLIATPHYMTDAYDNAPEIIRNGLSLLKNELKLREVEMEIEVAAEYFIDEFFLKKIGKEELLTFGKNYILIETGTLLGSQVLKDIIFELRLNGYQPVFAHPERYSYLWGRKPKDSYTRYKDMELLFQINIISLGGFYSPQVKKMAELLINENMVDFIGTDAHNRKYMQAVEESLKSKYIDKLMKANLLNDTL